MADRQSSMEEKLAALRAQYAGKIDERVDELIAIVKRMTQVSGEQQREIIAEMKHATHKLAGSGATFGFPDVTTLARDMEHKCIAILEGQDLHVPESFTKQLLEECEGIRKAVKGVDEADQHIVGVHDEPAQPEEPEEPEEGEGEDRLREPQPDLHDSSRMSLLIVMEYTEEQRKQACIELEHFGFDVEIVDHPSKMLGCLREKGALDVIVTGVDFDGAETAAFDALENLRAHPDFQDIPVVVYTEVDNMKARLGAVRADVKAYILKPVDMADLVNVLDRVTERHEEDPFRVVIVDDDEGLAMHTQVVLQSASMETRIVTNPMKIYNVLDDFSPELVLLDLYMPDCSGHEIAAIVRQREEYAGIPIVFLSGEADKDKQLSAMELGGDDFLTKPIRATHLVTSVRIRAARFRKLRSFMVRDSMTGLFNHTTTKQLLETEISRTQRVNGKLALAALDIDHFKNVNDTHGHAVGDRVIKALARLLRQRLRGADIIGRMGGEEFAAILPDSGMEEAAKVFEQIRKAFSEIVFHTEETSFSVTISCGISAFPHCDTATELSDAADKALYAAKHGGRNMVLKAD
ncbi:diguanylate cyclase [Magnetovibrio sp. PR-2]|uniref:diguanylate cyclase n=1 Tax=Magnetovibrio sp. PR-2 TaxID=3120356 RepID=UPI002FCE3ECB